MADSKNIIVGAAQFFVSKKDSNTTGAAPADFALPAAALSATGSITKGAGLTALEGVYRNVGYTQEGVEVSYEPDYGDVEVDQLLDSARIFKQSMRVMVNTTFAEAVLENLLIVWGQSADTVDRTDAANPILTIDAGSLGDAPAERALVFVGPAPRSQGQKERVYHVSRAIQTESSSHALRRSEVTALPVSFRILPADAVSGGKSTYGTVRDRATA
jgi:hypothetical protein